MRLLILTAQVSPYHNARYVGATRYFDEVNVLSTINAGDFTEFLAKSLGHYSLHPLFKGREAYQNAIVSGELVRKVRDTMLQVMPDAIAAAGWTAPESLAALEFGREYGIPVVVMSESQVDDGKRTYLRELAKRRIVSLFDAALVGGPSHAEYVETLGISRGLIHLGYNAVDNGFFTKGAEIARREEPATRQKLNLPGRYILASARFIEKKNLVELVRGYARAREGMVNAPDLLILGDGPERNRINATIGAEGLHKCVHMPGFRGYDELPALYALSEGFVHVSTSEQWGLVINEAMAAGVAVVASSRCGATRTVIENGVNGFVTEADTGSIAKSLRSLFELSAEQRRAIGEAAANAIASWGPDRFGTGLSAAVASALTAPSRDKIALWDRAILRRLQSRFIETVA